MHSSSPPFVLHARILQENAGVKYDNVAIKIVSFTFTATEMGFKKGEQVRLHNFL
jgi:hypothetical protein